MGGSGEGKDWELGISRCKLLYIEKKERKETKSRSRLINIENKLVVTRGEREEGRGKIGVGD